MSAWTCERCCDSASTSPARNAPSATDSPACCDSHAEPATTNSTAARKVSRERPAAARAMSHGTRRRAAKNANTTSPIVPSPRRTSSSAPPVVPPWPSTAAPAGASAALPPAAHVASAGTRSTIGTTARSCTSSTPVSSRPCGACSSPRSVIRRNTSAVEDGAIRRPKNTAFAGTAPMAMSAPATTDEVTRTCAMPAIAALLAQLLQVRERELEADREQQEHDADLGQRLDRLGLAHQAQRARADEDAGQQEAHDRRHLEAAQQQVHRQRDAGEEGQLAQDGQFVGHGAGLRGWREVGATLAARRGNQAAESASAGTTLSTSFSARRITVIAVGAPTRSSRERAVQVVDAGDRRGRRSR